METICMMHAYNNIRQDAAVLKLHDSSARVMRALLYRTIIKLITSVHADLERFGARVPAWRAAVRRCARFAHLSRIHREEYHSWRNDSR